MHMFTPCLLPLRDVVGSSLPAVKIVWAVQVNVNGLMYGGWGRENYGTTPVKVDALEVCDSSEQGQGPADLECKGPPLSY